MRIRLRLSPWVLCKKIDLPLIPYIFPIKEKWLGGLVLKMGKKRRSSMLSIY